MVRISPVEASRHIIEHVRDAWNHANPDYWLEEQEVILTVPASFDAIARTLTEEAARAAGLKNLTLIEEPHAAIYAWIDSHGTAWKRTLKTGQTVLICDIGGGTTDFSLIVVQGSPEGPKPVRVAVGDHLLIGGDNFDLALAHRLEADLVGPGKKLDPTRFIELAHACRHAKEDMFEFPSRRQHTVSVLGGGSRVIGGSFSAKLMRTDMIETLLNGFFPPCAPDDRPQARAGSGLKEFGLPYVSDPRISRHIASFLCDSRPAVESALGKPLDLPSGFPVRPDVVLFNGGTIKPNLLRARILGVMGGWYETLSLAKPRGLMNADADLAVAHGAVYYGRVRRGQGIRIHGGAPRSYYVGLGTGDATAGEARQLLLVAPRGMEEGDEIPIPSVSLKLKVGRLVAFPLYASSTRIDESVGSLVELEDGAFTALAPLSAVLDGPREGGDVAIELSSSLTETGNLELICRDTASTASWKLRFALRSGVADNLPQNGETVSREQMTSARAAIRNAFGFGPTGSPKPAKLIGSLMNELERPLGGKRTQWPSVAIRLLFETMQEVQERRDLSDAHESRFFNLAGFFLRPGTGMPGDEKRLENLWSLRSAGVRHKKNEDCHREWWILWRRVAPGLDRSKQLDLYDDLRPHIFPNEPRRRSVPKEALTRGSHDQMWRLAASLERLPGSVKEELGEMLLREIESGGPREFAFWTLARLGARVPLCGAAGDVVRAEVVSQWIQRTVRQLKKFPDKAGFALAQMARMTGDRARDLDDGPRRDLLSHLARVKATSGLITMVEQIVPVGHGEMAKLLGDALPAGLELETRV